MTLSYHHLEVLVSFENPELVFCLDMVCVLYKKNLLVNNLTHGVVLDNLTPEEVRDSLNPEEVHDNSNP